MGVEYTLDRPGTRFVFVHYHIFKNGGSTIEAILKREFRSGFATLHGSADNSVLNGNDLTEFLRQHPGLLAVSSHHLRYPKPAVPDWVIFDCCFLRHPLDRLASLYNHFRKARSSDPLSFRASRQEPREFMNQLLRDSPHVVSNVQVMQLANRGAFTRPADERDLERAFDVFRDMSAPGTLELFDESLVAAEYFLRPAFPALEFHHTPENVSQPARFCQAWKPYDVEAKLSELWGGDVYSALARMNELDFDLFRRATTEIKRRLALVPYAAETLANFRERCKPSHREVSMDETAPARAATSGAR